jgi:hypothetical protein
VYFTDHTYKSFMVGPEDTVRSLIMQVAKKVQVAPHGHYLLEMTGDGMHATLSACQQCVVCAHIPRVVTLRRDEAIDGHRSRSGHQGRVGAGR